MHTFISNAKTVRLLCTSDNRSQSDRKHERRTILTMYLKSKNIW